MLSTFIVEPTTKHTHTIIFLHGCGSDATEFASDLFESQSSEGRTLQETFPSYKWALPNAKVQRSEEFDTDLSQWFEMISVENPEEDSELQIEGLRDSVGDVSKIIEIEAAMVPEGSVVLAGISQGCAIAIHALFHSRVKIGAFIGLCSWLPLEKEVRSIVQHKHQNPSCLVVPELRRLLNPTENKLDSHKTNQSEGTGQLDHDSEHQLATPIFLSHSVNDDVVPVANGRRLKEGLESLGIEVTWKEYRNGAHWINEPQGVDDMVPFIKSCTGTKVAAIKKEVNTPYRAQSKRQRYTELTGTTCSGTINIARR